MRRLGTMALRLFLHRLPFRMRKRKGRRGLSSPPPFSPPSFLSLLIAFLMCKSFWWHANTGGGEEQGEREREFCNPLPISQICRLDLAAEKSRQFKQVGSAILVFLRTQTFATSDAEFYTSRVSHKVARLKWET